MWTRIESLICQWFQLVAVLQFCTHEGDAITVDGTLAGNGDVLSIVGPEPEHSLATVLAKSAQVINALVGIGLQCGCSLQIKFYIAFQLDWTSQESMVAR